jgi:hypothetical protein
MCLRDSYKASRIIETIENYSLIQNEYDNAVETKEGNNSLLMLYDDEQFWNMILPDPDKYWERSFNMHDCIVSFWVARIPGLFWSPNSQAIRNLCKSEIALRGQGWTEYNPIGKSSRVLGGIGTLLLPPDNDGYQLITLTFSSNASTGIPALVAPKVIEGLHLKEGDTLRIDDVKWRKMDSSWSQRFPSTSNIPKGYFLIEDPQSIEIVANNHYVEVHPYSIMEYEKQDALLYDFVYVTTDNFKKNSRGDLISFFEYYKNKEGRHGRYLLACDIAHPIFESQYNSPLEMKDTYSIRQLDLLKSRVRKEYFGKQTINELILLIPRYYFTPLTIRTLAGMINLPNALITDENAAKMSIQLISLCVERNKLEELIDRIAIDFPNVFKN